MLLTLPSGATVAVNEPCLRALLCGGGSRAALVDAVWAHAMDAGRLSDDDADALAVWCVRRAANDPEAEALATVCAAFGDAPSRRIGIDDPLLAFECDLAMAARLRQAGSAQAPSQTDDRGRVRFSTPGTMGER